jgi:hypothetical protein
VASDFAQLASDSSMNKGNQTAKLFLMGTVVALMLGIVIRSASLLQSHAIATESNAVGLQMKNLQSKLGKTKQADTELDEVKWSRIQNDLRANHSAFVINTQFVWQRFDPTARVRLLPGMDGKPGTADFDDNANGVIDDAGELGATFSDDLCIVEASQSEPSKIEPSIVLQRGAYVSAKQIPDQHVLHPDRILMQHQGVNHSWSFVLEW